MKKKSKGCVFCEKYKENKDKENYILERGMQCFTVLNLYPYNNGHLMIVPYRHIAEFENLKQEELNEMMALTSRAVQALKKAFKSEGFNIGANIGEIAGAGICEHVHLHVVPRWTSDTNFMPVLADTNVIPEWLDQAYDKLKKALGGLNEPTLEK